MWIMTDFGFYSVVRKPEDETTGKVTIRGRVRADLETLRDRFVLSAGPITEDPNADYPYKFKADEESFREALGRSIGSIDYSDFMKSVERKQGWTRHDIYEQVWSVLRQLYCCDQGEMTVTKG